MAPPQLVRAPQRELARIKCKHERRRWQIESERADDDESASRLTNLEEWRPAAPGPGLLKLTVVAYLRARSRHSDYTYHLKAGVGRRWRLAQTGGSCRQIGLRTVVGAALARPESSNDNNKTADAAGERRHGNERRRQWQRRRYHVDERQHYGPAFGVPQDSGPEIGESFLNCHLLLIFRFRFIGSRAALMRSRRCWRPALAAAAPRASSRCENK
jgi:hypothetical protein